jgi:hypothetical protein
MNSHASRQPRRRPTTCRPRLEALEDRWCPSSQRPIADFLSQQGTTSAFNFGVPGLPDEFGWSNSTTAILAGNGRFARIDYTGQDTAFLGLKLGTTTSGTVSERPLSDGRAEDTVNLHTHNAFAWATTFLPDGTNGDLLFGYPPAQLQANPRLQPPLADSDLHVVVTIPTPGAPLPDLVALVYSGGFPPGYALDSISFHATATGTTPTGQQATLVVSETALFGKPETFGDGGFTAEVVDVHIHGGSPHLRGSGSPTEVVNGPTHGTTSPTTVLQTAEPAASAAPAHRSTAPASRLSAVDAVLAESLEDSLLWDLG